MAIWDNTAKPVTKKAALKAPGFSSGGLAGGTLAYGKPAPIVKNGATTVSSFLKSPQFPFMSPQGFNPGHALPSYEITGAAQPPIKQRITQVWDSLDAIFVSPFSTLTRNRGSLE